MSTRKDFSVVALLQPPYRPKRHVDCRFPSHSSFFPFFFFLLSKAHRWSIHPHTQPRFDVRPDTLIDRGIYFFSYLSSHCPPLSHLFSFFHSLPPFLPLTSTSVHRSLASSFSKNAPPLSVSLRGTTSSSTHYHRSSPLFIPESKRERRGRSFPHFVSLFSSARLYR